MFYSLTFIKSYQSGHAMATVKTGLMNGNELVEEYSASHKKKVFFHSLQPGVFRGWGWGVSCQKCTLKWDH